MGAYFHEKKNACAIALSVNFRALDIIWKYSALPMIGTYYLAYSTRTKWTAKVTLVSINSTWGKR